VRGDAARVGADVNLHGTELYHLIQHKVAQAGPPPAPWWKRIRCSWFGHRMAPYNVSWSTREGDPQCALNDVCERCGEYRNPYIAALQQTVLRYHPEAIVSGRIKP